MQDSGYKLVNWSFEYVGRPRWQVTTAFTVAFLAFIFVSMCITLLAVLGWNELLKGRDAQGLRSEGGK